MASIVISVGTDEDNDYTEVLVAELKLNSMTVLLKMSTGDGDISQLTPDGFLDEFGQILNTCSLVYNELGTPIILDESVEDVAEEIQDGLYAKLRKTYRL